MTSSTEKLSRDPNVFNSQVVLPIPGLSVGSALSRQITYNASADAMVAGFEILPVSDPTLDV